MASDGVFDNLFDPQLTACVASGLTGLEMTDLQLASECIARQALMYGYKTDYVSPFANHAAEYGKRYEGGKDDDIVAIVAQIHTKNKGKHSIPTEV